MKRLAHILSLLDSMKIYPVELDVISYIERIRQGNTSCRTRCDTTDKITEWKDKLGNYRRGYCYKYFNGIYHNRSKKYYHCYINEFTFRLNKGNCNKEGKLDKLLGAIVGKTIIYEKLVA